MKLYFMIGLPTEEDDDVAGIVETAARVQAIGREPPARREVDGVGLDARAQAAHAVPVGGDGHRGGDRAQADPARRRGARALRVDLKMHENQQSHIEGIFSRGDRRVADLLERGVPPRLPLRQLGRCAAVDLWDQAIAETAAATGSTPPLPRHASR